MRLFFAAAAKNQRIATFQAHHVFTRQSLLHHQLFNEGLRRGLAATALAHVDDAGRGGCVGQHVRVHQVIHQHDAGGLQGFHRFEGQQFGVARTCADQGDDGRWFVHGAWMRWARAESLATCSCRGRGMAVSPFSMF